ncbi:hypothetical protein JW868_02720 [Candidatus Woesearchaeota archaeon]|nr:hypothetical protein [Candidatus Woesearchaeota archaeon]
MQQFSKRMLKPTAWRIALTIIIVLLYHSFLLMTFNCNLTQKFCKAYDGTPGAEWKNFSGEEYYLVAAKHPILSCEQQCTARGYYSETVKSLFLHILLPAVIAYLIVCAVLGQLAVRKKRVGKKQNSEKVQK